MKNLLILFAHLLRTIAKPLGTGEPKRVVADGLLMKQQFSVASPVYRMVRRSGLAEGSFKRRFTQATGSPPSGHVRRPRNQDTKRRVERITRSVEKMRWQTGYEDPAFRRLFERITELTPASHRRKLQIPKCKTPSQRR